ncbi:carcinoembryonic antigen-related cell adhesion molecule 1-like [Pristis pectinata]|uniref:carcinoembryonic antigen-related cell adhesion molecule 1-like n=1 Tax=Pristis pectinata TaxID=685728 RepID=UPI00223E53B3|nr:carcinoembryonic antigen-related cell adhesion molecule 1-like [Pristis pectinata]
MAGLPLTALSLCLFISAGESQVLTINAEHSRINVTDGGNALFSVRPSVEVSGGNWAFDGKTVVQWTGDSVLYGSGYQSRAEVFTTNGSLLLRSVNMSDSGEYILNMISKTGSSASATLTLRVLEPVSEPNITANATSLIEYNDTVKLTCSATGTAVSYLWLEENSTIIPGGRFELGADNSTLTIPGVLRTDGPFTCIAYNSISEQTSESFYLNVYYGPDHPNITTNPDSLPYTAGSTVTLTCSAESRPTANLDWYLNGAFLQTGQQLILDNISVSKTGNYTCQAFNNVTEKYNASTLEITVLEPVSNVTVTRNNLSPVEINDTVVLICDAQGTIQRRKWLKDNQPIQENDRIFTPSDKANLTIARVKRTDTGTYNCTVSNAYNSGSAAIYVQVNYGPDNVRSVPQGPVEADIGSPLTLTCSALSVPSGEYIWYSGTNHLQTGQQYTIEAVSSVDSGNYTCEVYNNITMKRSNLTVVVTARVRNVHSPGGLSAGEIAGIVIGVVAAVAIVGALAALSIKKNASRMKVPEVNHGSRKAGVNNTLATDVAGSSQTYENMPRNHKSSAHPPDENSTYMGLVLEDRSVYSDLRRCPLILLNTREYSHRQLNIS